MKNAKSDSVEMIEKQLRELGPEYLKRRESELLGIRISDAAPDWKRLETFAHRMKGSAKTYGYEGLGVLAGELEALAQRKDPKAIRELLDRIMDFIAGTRSAARPRES